jgi:hypothetical protein
VVGVYLAGRSTAKALGSTLYKIGKRKNKTNPIPLDPPAELQAADEPMSRHSSVESLLYTVSFMDSTKITIIYLTSLSQEKKLAKTASPNLIKFHQKLTHMKNPAKKLMYSFT